MQNKLDVARMMCGSCGATGSMTHVRNHLYQCDVCKAQDVVKVPADTGEVQRQHEVQQVQQVQQQQM